MFSDMIRFMQDGGFWMYPITLMLGIGIALMVERTYFLRMKFNVDGKRLYTEIRMLVLKGDIQGAINLCGDAPLPRILGAGLSVANRGQDAIQIAIDEEALEVIPMVEKRIHYLSMVANIATLLGLLGTVAGLIDAFAAVAGADPSQKGALLARGISIAMNTTYYGLIVAIPCMIAYSILQTTAQKIVGEVDEFSVKLINLLSERSGKF